MAGNFRIIILLISLFIIPQGLFSAAIMEGEESNGIVTYIEGEVILESNAARRTPELGEVVAPRDIITTGKSGKIKILFKERGMLTIVPSDVRIRIGDNGMNMIWGSKDRIVTKAVGSLLPNPNLDKRSRQLGGAFIVRALGGIQILNLNNTFIRETRPEFRWKFNKDVRFKASILLLEENDDSLSVWSREIKGSILEYPDSEPDLERGKTYLWEITAFDGDEIVSTSSARFYILGQNENASFHDKLQNLEKLGEDENMDEITLSVLKANLLVQFNLDDELNTLLDELRAKYPDTEGLNKMLNIKE